MSEEKPKSRRPANTAFKQQRLKAWQPLLTPKSVLPTLFILGVIFAPLGAFLLHASSSVSELIIDYTDCSSAGTTLAPPTKSVGSFSGPSADTNLDLKWKYTKADTNNPNNTCTLQFTIPANMEKSVFLYYRLTNFYQNHRRYVKSFDAAQLKGQQVTPTSVNETCKPFGLVTNNQNETRMYYPCGLIANSMFNDTLSNLARDDGSTYEFTDKGIAWPADKNKFGPPSNFSPDTHFPPPTWVKRVGDKWNSTPPNFATDERFQVWMRTAALPNFRKLYGRNDTADLTAGTYTMVIGDNFDVKSFEGTKAVVISTVSFMGGKNPFLGLAYIIIGAICIVLAVLFAARHLYAPRKLGDHTYLSWNHQPPPSTAAQ